MVPYDFFSQLFCLSLEKLIGVALRALTQTVPTVASHSVGAKSCCCGGSLCQLRVELSVCRDDGIGLQVRCRWALVNLSVSCWYCSGSSILSQTSVSRCCPYSPAAFSVVAYVIRGLHLIYCLHIRSSGFVSMALYYKPSHLKLSFYLITKTHIT